MRLKGQVAVVTGGSQGIGEALAKRYAAEGAKVAILNRNEVKAQSVVRAIQSSGGDATAFRSDVSRTADIERAIAGVVETYGTIHILVNNAAAYLMSPLGGTSEQAVDTMLSANVKGVFFLCQSVLPIFERNGGGKIINIGSIFGNDGFPGSAIYCATKGAISLLTKSLALELRERNIQVNAIAPGWIETPLNEEFRATDPGFMRRAAERFGGPNAWMMPEELTGADSVTGSILFVDRGWSAY